MKLRITQFGGYIYYQISNFQLFAFDQYITFKHSELMM